MTKAEKVLTYKIIVKFKEDILNSDGLKIKRAEIRI